MDSTEKNLLKSSVSNNFGPLVLTFSRHLFKNRKVVEQCLFYYKANIALKGGSFKKKLPLAPGLREIIYIIFIIGVMQYVFC